MRKEHDNFLRLGRAALKSDDAALLGKALIFIDAPAVRSIFEFYARDKYAANSRAG